MKIKLPHRVVKFTEQQKSMTGKEKVDIVNSLLAEAFEIDDETTTLEDYLYFNKNLPSAIIIKDMLAYFIVKEHRVKEEIMTRETFRRMQKGDGRTINFSNLKYNDAISMGLIDIDYQY